jgi:(1->4)-alpha-D-glucan 1-alpha-D-glucosylmutase
LRIDQEAALRDELHRHLRDAAVAEEFLGRLTTVVLDVDRLDDLLESQPYRLAKWQAGLEDLAYRRFFDVSNLVALRVDRSEVFQQTHAIVERWVAADAIDGVRVDHVDGLADPTAYLERLRGVVGDRWLVVEKILESGEELPDWPVDGTTGYEVATLIDRLDVADAGRAVLQHLAALAGAEVDVDEAETDAMGQVLDELLNSDLNRLVDQAVSLCEARRRVRDSTRREVHSALVAMLCRARQYRTYWRPGHPPRVEDLAVIDQMVERTRNEVDGLDRDVVSLLGQLARGEAGPGQAEAEFVLRFQQLSGPTRAKGCEDTAWYRLVTLISRCEVGSNPDDWGLDLASFHAAMGRRHAMMPNAMTSVSTHDSKRSADVRARIDTLSQWAPEFAELVRWWWARAGLGPMPSFDLYALQTVIGVPGLGRDRLDDHLVKAMREAKNATSWLRPVEPVEREVLERVHAMLDDPDMRARLDSLDSSIDPVSRTAVLSHTLLALCVPGVPDLYQGTETWHYRLVDPDNRVPVDPQQLAHDLDTLGSGGSPLAVGPQHGLAKVALTRLALDLRARRSSAFGGSGTYRPMWASGARANHVVAFTRGDQVGVVVPRLGRALGDGWGDTVLSLPEGRWENVCTGERCVGAIRLDDLLAAWPVALLERHS